VLVVDDEEHMVNTLRHILADRYQVRTAATGEEALDLAAEAPPHVTLLDIMMPGLSGLEVLRRLKEVHPETEVIMVTALDDVRKAVEAMKAGAHDYITKPFEEEDLIVAIEKALEKSALNREVASLRKEVAGAYGIDGMVGATKCMRDLLRQIQKVSDRDVNVLITGESGTGKELIARAIHYRGIRKRGPFVPVNCGRFGGELTESELFGHVKGAFTGATAPHKGKFEQADGGTLFLDEIGAMPLSVQAQLLRVLEDKKVERVGSEKRIDVDVRVIAATNADLAAESREGRFRQDLFYRLKVIHLEAPPLRERRDDIPLLVDHFLKKHGSRVNSTVCTFTPEALERLKSHPWRGNVRELENVVLTVICMAEGDEIEESDLDAPILEAPALPEGTENISRESLLALLEAEGWNLSATARKLGVHRNTVRNLMDRFEIRKPAGGPGRPPGARSSEGA
jgi:DNA-binding NtrC family response regulator